MSTLLRRLAHQWKKEIKRFLGRVMRTPYRFRMYVAEKQKNCSRFTGFGPIHHAPLISVIVVSYHSGKELEELFPSLRDQGYTKFEVILVENGKTSSEAVLRKYFPSGKYVQAEFNQGFAAANNLGLELASGELVALLNPDTKVDCDWLGELFLALASDTKAIAAAPLITFFHPFVEFTFESVSEFLLDLGTLEATLNYRKYFVLAGQVVQGHIHSNGENWIILRLPLDSSRATVRLHSPQGNPIGLRDPHSNFSLLKVDENGNLDWFFELTREEYPRAFWVINNAGSGFSKGQPHDLRMAQPAHLTTLRKGHVQAFCGCSVLLRRVALVKRPLFEPAFFAYFEDSELSWYFKTNRYKIVFTPSALVRHRHTATSSEGSLVWKTLVDRSRELFAHFAHGMPIKKVSYSSQLATDLVATLKHLDASLIDGAARTFKQTVAIFNNHWNAFGGGEVRALLLGKKFEANYKVYLLSEKDFSVEKLSDYFNLDCRNFQKLVISRMSSHVSTLFDVFINSTLNSNLVSYCPNSYFLTSFPHKHTNCKFLRSYTFVHNSEFTKKWALKFWGPHKNEVIYPIGDIPKGPTVGMMGQADRKKCLLLSVGRIVRDGHQKNHDLIIKAFRNAKLAGKIGDEARLIITGSTNLDTKAKIAYFGELTDLARGFPIEIIPNISPDRLNALYDEADVYVHASGLGKDPRREPEKHEHFGIVVFEAAIHGAKPLVYSVGGPAELVAQLGGTQFTTPSELEEQMVQMVAAALGQGKNTDRRIIQEKAKNLLLTNLQRESAIFPFGGLP